MLRKMKFMTILMLLVLVFYQAGVQAQWTSGYNPAKSWDNGFTVLEYQGKISGTDTLITNSFVFGNAEAVFNVAKIFSQTNDSIKVTILRQANYIGSNWTTQKTLYSADSTKTQATQNDTLSTSVAFPQRLVIYGTTGNGYQTNVNIKLRIKQK